MHISPFCAGMFTTIIVECIAFVVWVIYLNLKNK